MEKTTGCLCQEDVLFRVALLLARKRGLLPNDLVEAACIDNSHRTRLTYVIADADGNPLARLPLQDVLRKAKSLPRQRRQATVSSFGHKAICLLGATYYLLTFQFYLGSFPVLGSGLQRISLQQLSGKLQLAFAILSTMGVVMALLLMRWVKQVGIMAQIFLFTDATLKFLMASMLIAASSAASAYGQGGAVSFMHLLFRALPLFLVFLVPPLAFFLYLDHAPTSAP